MSIFLMPLWSTIWPPSSIYMHDDKIDERERDGYSTEIFLLLDNFLSIYYVTGTDLSTFINLILADSLR